MLSTHIRKPICAAFAFACSALLAAASLPTSAYAEEIQSASEAVHVAKTVQVVQDEKSTSLGLSSTLNKITYRIAGTSEDQALGFKDLLSQSAIDMFVNEALNQVGAPYVSGGSSPSGFDCSGLVKYCADKTLGIDFARTSTAQSWEGELVDLDETQYGDLLFWGRLSSSYHVGICLGNGTYVHAAGTGQGVRVDTEEYYAPDFACRVNWLEQPPAEEMD